MHACTHIHTSAHVHIHTSARMHTHTPTTIGYSRPEEHGGGGASERSSAEISVKQRELRSPWQMAASSQDKQIPMSVLVCVVN